MWQPCMGPMNKGSIVERFCSDLRLRIIELRYKSSTLLLLFTFIELMQIVEVKSGIHSLSVLSPMMYPRNASA